MKHFAILTLALLLFISTCSKKDVQALRFTKYDNIFDFSKPIAHGENKVIQVLVGRENLRRNSEMILASFESEIKLSHPEKVFEVRFCCLSALETVSKYRNIVICGDLESGDSVSVWLKQSLDKDLLDKVKTSGAELFSLQNYWVRDQSVLFFVAQNPARLSELLTLQAKNAFNILVARYRDRLGYLTYQLKLIDQSVLKDLPFSLKIPENFQVFTQDKTGRYISLISRSRVPDREKPDKYISVYYEDMPENRIEERWLIEKRGFIGEKYFDGDILIDDEAVFDETTLGKYKVLKMTARWENRKHLIGGALISYALWNEQHKRAYLVDTSVFFPAGDKLPVLLELGVLAETFELK